MGAETASERRTTAGGEASMSAEREWARRQVEKKRKLRDDVLAYIVINAFLTAIWALTGFGYFWPAWIMGGWGMFLLLDAVSIYYRRPITEDDIDREMSKRLGSGSKPRV